MPPASASFLLGLLFDPPKEWAFPELHGVTTQKTVLFTVLVKVLSFLFYLIIEGQMLGIVLGFYLLTILCNLFWI
jgi:hypothetical protein